MNIPIGTRSVRGGYHTWWLHPLFVALGWIKVYGWGTVTDDYVTTSIWDWKLWYAFFVHDIGYVGKPNMDGPEGEQHPLVGANRILCRVLRSNPMGTMQLPCAWYNFVLCHSRYMAKRHGLRPSALCMADKLAFALYPRWLLKWLVYRTGEVHEYMAEGIRNGSITTPDFTTWHRMVCGFVQQYVTDHKDGQDDHVTPTRH
jgi:hypothetical protein